MREEYDFSTAWRVRDWPKTKALLVLLKQQIDSIESVLYVSDLRDTYEQLVKALGGPKEFPDG